MPVYISAHTVCSAVFYEVSVLVFFVGEFWKKPVACAANKLYLQSDVGVFGHVFSSFISLYIHFTIEDILMNAGLNRKMMPIDLLHKYNGVYHIDLKGRFDY